MLVSIRKRGFELPVSKLRGRMMLVLISHMLLILHNARVSMSTAYTLN